MVSRMLRLTSLRAKNRSSTWTQGYLARPRIRWPADALAARHQGEIRSLNPIAERSLTAMAESTLTAVQRAAIRPYKNRLCRYVLRYY